MSKIHSSIPLAQNLAGLCIAKGIQQVVISPGSRNAPLSIEFANNPEIEAHSIVDERCAAFFALGLAKQLRKPVALLCTSGSALLNYYPAVAEAFYSDIPLVVISADRPEHLIDVGDGQTIRQPNVFQNHILYSANLKNGIHNEMLEKDRLFNETEINSALNKAIAENGPVHINAPFDEPLYGLSEKKSGSMENRLVEMPNGVSDENEVGNFIEAWNASEKKMVLVGVNYPNEIDQKYLDILGKDESVLVFTETTSNLHHSNYFPSIDSIIAPIEKDENAEKLFKKLQPEILLTFGGMVVSKKIKSFLRKYPPKQHFHIDPKKAYDTFFCLSGHFKTKPNSFFERFLPKSDLRESNYRPFWDKIKIHRREKRDEYLKNILFSDFLAFDLLLKNIPKGEMLQIGNSSAIRYSQLFDIDASISVFCNRGASGIDGSTSTAIGAGLASGKPTTLITGDLGFFYDSNALWNDYIPENFKIIIVNNGGGGIFRILPGDKKSGYFEKFFETPHGLTAEYLAKMYSFEYEKALDEKGLTSILMDFHSKKGKRILEIFTPRKTNDKVLLRYFEFIR